MTPWSQSLLLISLKINTYSFARNTESSAKLITELRYAESKIDQT